MQQIFTLHQHPRPEGWTIQQYQHELEKHYPELSNDIAGIGNNLNKKLYDEEYHPSRSEIPVLNQAKRIVEYQYEIPLPAEKQIKIIRGFFRRIFPGKSIPFMKPR